MKADDLRERTFRFGIRCIKLAETVAGKGMTGDVLARQLMRCGTSVGANYRAAARGRSRVDFVAKLGIVREECDETIYWIDVIGELRLIEKRLLADLRREADELLAIMVSSIKTARANAKSAVKK